MRYSFLSLGLPQSIGRFGAIGLFLTASIAFAGNGSQNHGQSVRLKGTEAEYPLTRGVTSFIISLTNPARNRSFTFVNQNPAAEGQLAIAVSSRPLAADSTRWSRVEGAIRFQHKKRFAVSLVGIEADYVRLTFQVDARASSAASLLFR